MEMEKLKVCSISETLRNFRSSRNNVKSYKQSCIPNINFKANIVCENYDQRLQLETKDDKNARK